tara:strand:- start:2239 stop:3084 length:846 start_codon:yes stop_codon:yes gene_type:complete
MKKIQSICLVFLFLCSYKYNFSQEVITNNIDTINDLIQINYRIKSDNFKKKFYDIGLYYSNNRGKKWKKITETNSISGDIGFDIRSGNNKKIFLDPSLNKKLQNRNVCFGIKMEKTQGLIKINGSPRNASVYIDNQFLGYTPLRERVKTRNISNIKISKENYNDFLISEVESKFNSNKKFEYNYVLNLNQHYVLQDLRKKKSKSFIYTLSSLSIFSYFFIKTNIDYNKYLNSNNNDVQLQNFKNSKKKSGISIIVSTSLSLRHVYLNNKYKNQIKSIYKQD